MPIVRIAVDNREAASGIPDILRKRGMYVQMKTLDIGDYVIGEYAVERKTVRDFLSSMYSGRLFEQAQRISGAYKEYLLIVEGDTREMLADVRNPRAYWGALLFLVLNLDFKVFFALDRQQTADILASLSTRYRGKPTKPLLIKKPRMGTIKERQLSVIETLPSIGPKLAEQLLASFGSVRNVFHASRVDLALKGGLGYARAERIRELLDAQYPSDAVKQTKL